MDVFESPDDERILATNRGFAFCRLASKSPVSSRELGFDPVPLELDVEDPEEDGPKDIFGLGTFGCTAGGVPAVVGNGTISKGFFFRLGGFWCSGLVTGGC